MYLTVAEVAAHYRVSQDTVRRWIREKRLPAEDIGRGKRPTYRIPSEAVLQKRFKKPDEEFV